MKTKHRVIIGDSGNMLELENSSIQLIVTSPPYPMIAMWDSMFKLVGCETYDQMHSYLTRIWKECFRVLIDGGIACINIGDATRKVDGEFQLFPNHARILEHCREIGFVSLPYILWKKPTTRTKYKGKGAYLGSGMLPPNAYVTMDCEYILILRKNGLRKFPPHHQLRYKSAYTKEERDVWFSQIWNVLGTKQTDSKSERRTAAFPEEIPHRLIRMFSIIGDTVLDPFLGSGTTSLVAARLGRNSVGYEITSEMIPLLKKTLGVTQAQLVKPEYEVEFIHR